MGWQDDPIMQSAQTKPWESDAIVNPKKDEPKKQTTTPEFLVNQFKKGLSATPALVGLAADLVNHVVTDPVAHILGYKGFAENAAQLAQNKAEEALNVDKGMKEPTNKYGDTSILTHIGGSIAEMAGSMAVPEVGILGSAAKTAIAAKDATKFTKPLAKEALGIALSGEGGVMGENVSRMDVFHPEGSNVHDKEQEGYFLGSLTGPLAGMKLIDFVGKGGNWIEKIAEDTGIALGGKARQEAAAKKIVGSKLGSQLSSPVTQKNLAESEKISKEIPGFGENITLGRASNVPEIKLKEKQMSDTQADIHRLALEREAGLDKSIHDYAAAKFEMGEAKPNSSAAKIYAELSEKLVDKIKNLNIQFRQLSAQFSTRGSEDIGKDARDLLVKQFDLARDAKNAKYDAVRSEADKNGIKVQVSDVLGMAKSIKINHWSTFQDDAGIVGKILNLFGEAKPAKTVVKDLPRGKMTLRGTPPAAEAKSVPFGQFSSLLREANAEAKTLRIAQSLGDVKAGTKLVQVEKVRDVLASKMAEMALPQYGSVGKLLKDANSFYANVYAKTFKQGAGAELLKKGRFGEYAVDNSKIMSSTLFKPNNPSAVKEFLEATGGTPEARKVLENGAYDILSMKVKNGVLSKSDLSNFIKSHAQSLDLLPELSSKLSTAESAMDAIGQNAYKTALEKKQLSQSVLAKIAKTERPDAVVSKALVSPEYLNTLMNNMDEPSRQALANAMAEKVMKTSDPEALLNKNKDAFVKAMGNKRFSDLQTIAAAVRIKNRVSASTSLNEAHEPDILKRITGTSISSAASTASALGKGFVSSKAYLTSSIGMRWWNTISNKYTEELMAEAIYNPEVGKKLTSMLKGTAPAQDYKVDPHKVLYLLRGAAQLPNTMENQNNGARQ